MIKRILLSTINGDHPQRGITHAFSGIFGSANVADYDYLAESRRGVSIPNINMGFLKKAIEHRPDWIFLQVQDSRVILPETIISLRSSLPKTVISHWLGDLRPDVSPYLSSFCKVTDLTLISSVGQIPLYEKAGGKRVKYCQIGVDWEEDVIGLPDWTPHFRVPDVVLCGYYYPGLFPGTVDREAGIRALMDAKIDVGIVGRGWPAGYPMIGECTVKQQYHVWKRAKVGLNINHFNDIELYYSDRQIISMVSGTPVVCYHVPNLEREFTDGTHCLFYRKPDELVANVKRLLADKNLRKKIGDAGRAEVMKNHTWFSRILSVLPDVEKISVELK
jgi:hypothetical protein